MSKYRVIRNYDDHYTGEIIELNERRAKSELRNGNVVEYKEEKVVYQTKQWKGKRLKK